GVSSSALSAAACDPNLDWFTDGREIESVEQARLLRDIFENPFRPVPLHSDWLTANVTAIAQAIYDERAFDRMPILADALQDAACTNQDILAHCRGPGTHAR